VTEKKRTKIAAKKPTELTSQQVRDYLVANPEFLAQNPDIFSAISPPERELGDGVIDFQSHMVKRLQKDSKALEDRYAGLVDFCRDNMSVQAQVHHAALRLIRARTLEQLLEVLTLDLVSLFDVDIVRLALESDTLTYDGGYQGDLASGIVFIPRYTVEGAMGKKKNVLLVSDTQADPFAGFEHIFVDSTELVRSCALLRLKLDLVDKQVILAFGVRYPDRFHAGQGVELLSFLGNIVAHQLDTYMDELTV
jgi:uncharacterized protein YigA (DUF484 family)